jgi:protein-disulfide isomerase
LSNQSRNNVNQARVQPTAQPVWTETTNTGGSWLSQNIYKLLAAVLGLALVGIIIGVALSHRAPNVELPSLPNVQPTAQPTTPPSGVISGIDPVVGLPIDGTGALVAAEAAPVIIDIFSDFGCPFCAQFESAYTDQILQLAGDPNFSVRLHPVAVLDRTADQSGYSSLAAAIMLETAISHPQYVWAMNDLLLTYQQQGAALSGAELIDFVGQTGLQFPDISQVTATNLPLLDQFNAAFRNSGASGVPHIQINGQPWSPGGLPWPNESLFDAAHAALG